jgi:D-tyrosyl-tRNA(Tyr) deacylase
MRALIQRVSQASVIVESKTVGTIKKGLLVFLGIGMEDTQEDETWLLQKILKLRLFNDDEDKINLSLDDIGGSLLIVSQFTLQAQIKKGNRPGFSKAAKPELALKGYQDFCEAATLAIGVERVAQGVFGAHMEVNLVNDGPLTIWIDTKNKE